MSKPRSITFNVTLQWYLLYATGKKREEYREIKPHWDRRLFDDINGEKWPKEFDRVVIRCGYKPNPQTPDLVFKWVNTRIGEAKEGIGRELMGDAPCYVVEMEDI